MVVKRAYKRVSVNDIDRDRLLDSAIEFGGVGTVLGLDIAKQEIVCCLRWGQGQFERPWKVVNPQELDLLVQWCEFLRSRCDGFTVGMESTGTYGDGVRYALSKAGINLQRVSGKAVSDYQEIFDGVPSQHDGKDAAIVAELVSIGKGSLWPYSTLSDSQQILRHQVLRMDAYSKLQTQWLGRLEAMVARHWPELTDSLKLSSVTIQSLLATYGSAAKAHADPQLATQLRLWGRQYLEEEKLQHLVSSASTTKGLPMSESECLWMQEIAGEVLKAHRVHLKCVKEIETQIASEPVMERYRAALGGPTLAVIWSEVGDPAKYASAGAFLKALGLNLKERSSGQRNGQLAISKRGPALSRRWIYFWALRAIQRDELKGWYSKFNQAGKSGVSDKRRKMKAMIAMMRKLCKSLWHVRVNDKNFDYALVVSSPSPTPGRRRRRRKTITS